MLLQNKSDTLLEVFEHRSKEFPDKIIYRFLLSDSHFVEASYDLFLERVKGYAAFLQEQGLRRGDRALILCPPGMEYLYTFFGCIFAGVIAVPAYPPDYKNLERLLAILTDCEPSAILGTEQTCASLSELMEPFLAANPAKVLSLSESVAKTYSHRYLRPGIHSHSIAFLQYTSGSTSMPKGVVLTHENLITNAACIGQALKCTCDTEMVSWLPPYHDMGLIGSIIHPYTMGMKTTLMSPMSFVKKPLRWLQAISDIRSSDHIFSTAPNFAYELCCDRITDGEASLLDLSRWKIAPCGAEPIKVQTFERFCQKFAASGFHPSYFLPVYGLAEATLHVSGGVTNASPMVVCFDKVALEKNVVRPVESTAAQSIRLIGCGEVVANHEISIVDSTTKLECSAHEVGEIWFRGKSVAKNYWNFRGDGENFGAFTKSGRGPFLRTGDLGFSFHGQLFVTGRIKDCFIIMGRNHYPQDIERTISNAHDALRKDCTAVFCVHADSSVGAEKVVAVQEIKRQTDTRDFTEVFSSIRKRVFQEHSIALEQIVLIGQSSIPKTSSGKIQRGKTKQLYIERKLSVLATSSLELDTQ